jgi:nucleotide-binding universal stress UspA family protein
MNFSADDAREPSRDASSSRGGSGGHASSLSKAQTSVIDAPEVSGCSGDRGTGAQEVRDVVVERRTCTLDGRSSSRSANRQLGMRIAEWVRPEALMNSSAVGDLMNNLIVCATDFSSQADAALAWAAAQARRSHGAVDLVHVARLYHDDSRTVVFDASLVDVASVESATVRLRQAAQKASQELGVAIRPHVSRGEPHEAILEHARREHARLVVLGTSGRSSLERWMLGSVAERTVRAADRPIVLVPQLQEPSPWQADAIRPPRVLAGLGDRDDGGIVAFVGTLRAGAPCDVTFAHLYRPLAEYTRLGLTGPVDPTAPDPAVVKNLEPVLRRTIEGLPGQGKVSLDIRPARGDTIANIFVATEEHEADLLVVGVEHRSGFVHGLTRSIGERLAVHSRYVPIACVPVERSTAVGCVPSVRTVLAVTDFSELGNSAVPHAYSLLRDGGGVVELCHVHERPLPAPGCAHELPAWKLADLERASLVKKLRALVPPDATSLGVTTHLSVVDGGRAAEAIVQASERLDVDVICMASRGRGGLAGTVLGSVVGEVIHRSRRPVFVVRKG